MAEDQVAFGIRGTLESIESDRHKDDIRVTLSVRSDDFTHTIRWALDPVEAARIIADLTPAIGSYISTHPTDHGSMIIRWTI